MVRCLLGDLNCGASACNDVLANILLHSIFSTSEFVASSSGEFRPFLEELAMTQQFDDFVTRRMYNASNEADIIFFDQSIDAKKNRSRRKFKKVDTPFLHSASAHRDLKLVQAVEPNAEDLPSLPDDGKAYI